MYNYNKLRGLIREYCETQEAFANAIGISATTLVTRLNGSTYFKQTEIEQSAKLFKLDMSEINEIFFVKQ